MSSKNRLRRVVLMTVAGIVALCAGALDARAQSPGAPFIEEWVYKVKFGYQDEFWKVFKKYQIATLNREKELGSVVKYEVFRPGLHTSEDHRWDFRIVIYYKDATSSGGASAIEKQLFPDQEAMKREELRRWDLTEVHWDLPIRQMDPNAN